MPQFTVDEDLAALVEKLAKPKPFENISFNSALSRILKDYIAALEEIANNKVEELDELEQLLSESMTAINWTSKKAPSPNPAEWVATIPELANNKELTTWKAICDALKIHTAGDSARRKLKNWVKANRPEWPAVPDIG